MISWFLSRWVFPAIALTAILSSGLFYVQSMRMFTLKREAQDLRVQIRELERGQELLQKLQQENEALRRFSLSLSRDLRNAEDYNRPLSDDFRGTLERLRQTPEFDTGFRF